MTEYEKVLIDHHWTIDKYWAYIESDEQLPTYGWKLHISFDYQYAEDAAKKISRICKSRNLHGKIISSLDMLVALNSGARVQPTQVGKAATIYFPSVDRLLECLPLISSSLTYHGVPVITDRRVKNSRCLSLRYGQFKMIPSGDFSEPNPPSSDSARLVDLLEEFEPQFPKQFSKINLIRHSAKGNSYFAFDNVIKKEVFVKSGFKYGRLNADASYGDKLIRKEEHSFIKIDLPGVVHTPKIIRSFEDEDTYISVREIIKGPNLHQLRESGSPELLNRVANGIIISLALWLDHNEQKGIRIYDLSPTNFVLDSRFNLFFVDAEYVFSDRDRPPREITLLDNSRDLSLLEDNERYDYEKNRIRQYIEGWMA